MDPLTFDAVHNLVTQTIPWSQVPGESDMEPFAVGDIHDSAESSTPLRASNMVFDWTEPLVDRMDLADLLEDLDPRERLVIEAAYLNLDPQSDKELGIRLGVTRSMVGRIRRRALARLKVSIKELES